MGSKDILHWYKMQGVGRTRCLPELQKAGESPLGFKAPEGWLLQGCRAWLKLALALPKPVQARHH